MKYYIPAIVLLILVTYLSVSPKLTLPNEGVPEHSDKVAHFLAYFFLSFSAFWGFLRKNNRISSQQRTFIVLFYISYSFLLEIIQELMPGVRQFDGLDILANTVGIFSSNFVFKRFIA